MHDHYGFRWWPYLSVPLGALLIITGWLIGRPRKTALGE